MSLPSQARQLDLDLVRTVAIFGTVLIHATAVGGFNWAFGSAAWTANLLARCCGAPCRCFSCAPGRCFWTLGATCP